MPPRELRIKLPVRAANDAQRLPLFQHRRQQLRQLADRPAAHAAAHHKQMLLLRRNAQRALRLRLLHRVIKRLRRRKSGRHELFPRHTAAREFLRQQRRRDKVEVQIGVRCARAACVIRGDKARLEPQRISPQQLRDSQRREHMRADDIVIAAAFQILPHPVHAGGQVFVDRRSLAEDRFMLLHVRIAGLEELRRVTVDARVPVGNKAGGMGRDKLQRIHDVAKLSALLIDLLNGLGAGVMPRAGIAAHDQRPHSASSFFVRAAFFCCISSSLTRRGRLYRWMMMNETFPSKM